MKPKMMLAKIKMRAIEMERNYWTLMILGR